MAIQNSKEANCYNIASNQALPSRIIIYVCKEGESLEDFDHVLALVGRGQSRSCRPFDLLVIALQ